MCEGEGRQGPRGRTRTGHQGMHVKNIFLHIFYSLQTTFPCIFYDPKNNLKKNMDTSTLLIRKCCTANTRAET